MPPRMPHREARTDDAKNAQGEAYLSCSTESENAAVSQLATPLCPPSTLQDTGHRETARHVRPRIARLTQALIAIH